jgi:lipopolysaccharide transport system ATP-binding protein
VIGRNGAGKSTLLKILARITEPTEGRAEIYGRVGSLLEVGTGFHPELTGRENIYLNGAILGMRKAEVTRDFDEIVAFAEVERFLDTAVKRYSSGMYMRLAFAVAAHLNPEILLVDEVLSVGDAAFQKRCLGKMGEVASQGRTVLFVSHNLAAVNQLCSRAVYLKAGGIAADGKPDSIIGDYLNDVSRENTSLSFEQRTNRSGDGRIRFTGLDFENARGERTTFFRSGEDCSIALHYRCPDGNGKRNVIVSVGIRDHLGVCLIHHRTNFTNENFDEVAPTGTFVCQIPDLPLSPGDYSVAAFVGINEVMCDLVEDAAFFSVEVGDFFGTGSQGMPSVCRLLSNCSWALRTAGSYIDEPCVSV